MSGKARGYFTFLYRYISKLQITLFMWHSPHVASAKIQVHPPFFLNSVECTKSKHLHTPAKQEKKWLLMKYNKMREGYILQLISKLCFIWGIGGTEGVYTFLIKTSFSNTDCFPFLKQETVLTLSTYLPPVGRKEGRKRKPAGVPSLFLLLPWLIKIRLKKKKKA